MHGSLARVHRMRDAPLAVDFANPAKNGTYLTDNQKGYQGFTEGKAHRAAMQLMPHVINGTVPGRPGQALTQLICR